MTDVLRDKVALVTGGGSGIGRAASLAFAREGARVAIADWDPGGSAETARMIEDTGGIASVFEVDVTRAAQVSSLIDKIVDTYGRLDCAFNNAGVGGEVALTADYREEEWDRILDVNLKGVWLCMKYEIPVMVKQGSGAIVNTASIYGLAGHETYVAYNAAKHGVVGLTKTAALEYAKAGIRINAVCPGYILTPMTIPNIEANPALEQRMVSQTPMGRLGNPEEIAETVLWLCSDAASFVTGHTMATDGGYMAQ